ncbi:hypothetical protein pEaSNUABM50_00291 [Erwinia phage pEa_SNUABM_50]|uniref:Uncharacterized protein n=4 Tax=Eneladusvirus BF TaxID=2560751 RepID=A0A7L8ZMR5_9CAUD|nr:hypothetical protein FDH34_gp295 [Serratia phage BF]QOI71232.1 hypothetical protein pEaSNUABM12_00294 [Erwinia phage pEa_SNUABM_12]QOI71776.1 hypothetical protein pEaSNUABM47_00292 [Erwinia phage pEa_SNUABM_47]QOI72315.1 hypothetical protein pEaSNUABM50_00291 [Erwinia phage pEa_SNUABM_50]QXO11441.1 hypothetical protein pEaSNUABM19_00295 [Erwinia phage pEa_SNUABM_19]QXO11989.1 hypothetical protein pEaSNUABM44_00293 [Erwinia phage pEa_SNUABM_44]QXO12542.1 hypothetical protein pEaSNUABM49_002
MSDDFGEWEQRKQGVDLMSDIMSAFDDIEEGRPVPKKLPDGSTFVNDFDQINRAETKNLLYALQEVTGEYGNIHQEDAQYYDQGGYLGESNDYDSVYGYYEPQEGETFIQDPSYVKMKQVQPQQNAYSAPVQQSRPYVPGQNWSIIEESVLGMKSAKVYSIKCNATNQVVMDNIMMYESALALKTILNDGKTLTDPKVLGIISSGIQYTRVITEAINAAKKRQQVLKESRYDKAQELDKEIAEHKSKATELKERVLNFLREEGFITK